MHTDTAAVRKGEELNVTALTDHLSGKIKGVEDGIEVEQFPGGHSNLTYRVEDAHPELASVLGETETEIELPGRRVQWRGRLEVGSDATHFLCRIRRELLENGRPVRDRGWEERIPRDHQ